MEIIYATTENSKLTKTFSFKVAKMCFDKLWIIS